MHYVQNFGGVKWAMNEKSIGRVRIGGMGFWDLKAFNLAMLAKKGWRMVQGNDSLLYKCFKARYFPRSNFLEAKESPNCSLDRKSVV